jgi:hypothetical protein
MQSHAQDIRFRARAPQTSTHLLKNNRTVGKTFVHPRYAGLLIVIPFGHQRAVLFAFSKSLTWSTSVFA